MQGFTGAALYTVDEIGRALENRKTLEDKYQKIFEEGVEECKKIDTSYKAFGCLWKVDRTLYDQYQEELEATFGSYFWMEYFLSDNNIISKKDADKYHKHCRYYTTEGREVTNLYNGGKDCYLNPDQAKFINYYKDINVEEE